MILYFITYGLVFLYFFLLSNEGKVDITMFTSVKHTDKKVFFVEFLSRISFIILILFIFFGFINDKIDFNIISLLLQILSLCLFVISKKTMATNWATNIKNSQETLSTNGVFKYSRNPVYIAYHLLFISMLFINPLLFAIPYIFFAIAFHFLILQEEKFLKKQFKEEYRRYCNNTRRYI